MTAPIIGKDCDIVLVHPQVNGGEPYGFILSPDPQKSGSAFSIQRNLDANGDTFIFLFATILLADDLKNPDGSEHAASKVTMYEMLLDFLDHVDEISISTFDGTFLGLGQLGHTSTELHLVDATYISIKFANLSTYHPPIDSDLFFGSIWQPSPAGVDAFTWETSVWR